MWCLFLQNYQLSFRSCFCLFVFLQKHRIRPTALEPRTRTNNDMQFMETKSRDLMSILKRSSTKLCFVKRLHVSLHSAAVNMWKMPFKQIVCPFSSWGILVRVHLVSWRVSAAWSSKKLALASDLNTHCLKIYRWCYTVGEGKTLRRRRQNK